MLTPGEIGIAAAQMGAKRPRLKQPQDVQELVEYLATHDTIRYQGPMDHKPWICQIVRYTVRKETPEYSDVTLDGPDRIRYSHLRLAEHLERFWLEA
jgi:hypothetical protein